MDKGQAADELARRGVTLEDMKNYFLTVAEPVAAMGSGIVAEPLAGFAGLAAAPFGSDAAANAVNYYRDKLTYSPRSEAGQSGMAAIGEAMAPIGEAMDYAASGAGDYVYDKTGSPALAAAAYSAPTAALELLGLKGVNQLSKSGKLGQQLEFGDIGSGGVGNKQRGIFAGVKAKAIEELEKRGISMDYDSRMARAKEQGHESGWYHGTGSDIEAFDPSKAGTATLSESAKQGTWLTDDPEITANSYANYAATDAKVEGKVRQADAAGDRGDWDLYDKLTNEAETLESDFYDDRKRGQNIMPLSSRGKLKKMDAKGESFSYAENNINDFIRKAKSEGFDGVEIANLDDAVGRVDVPATHRLVFDPANIRSVNAAFDPADIGKSGLLKSVGGVGLGYQFLGGEDEQNQL
tara:strand:- start:2026 stop:3249 length:1224 start_codon:yes stop_codon:yes gene_type:complete